jgi:prepilin-type processing-associated H-X9-DG protein
MEDFRSHHPLGVNLALADGSVRLINESVDLDACRGAATRSGREILGDF